MSAKVVVTKEYLQKIGEAIIAKGGASAPMKPQEMAGAIGNIPSGGETDPYRVGYRWNPPKDWPNLRKLVAEMNPEDYGFPSTWTYKRAFLVCTEKDISIFRGNRGVVFSDGEVNVVDLEYTNVKHIWDKSKDVRDSDGRLLRWCVSFGPTSGYNQLVREHGLNGDDDPYSGLWQVANHDLTGPYYPTAANKNQVGQIAIETSGNISSDNIRWFNAFFKTTYLRGNIKMGGSCNSCMRDNRLSYFDRGDVHEAYLRGESAKATITFTTGNSVIANMFENSSLSECPNLIGLSNVIDIRNAFYASCFIRLQDDLDFSNVEVGKGSAFLYMRALVALPTNMKINTSFSFEHSYGVSHDSVATFAPDGSVNGGMIGNLNTCANDGQTVTLNETIKGLFTADQQTAIANCLTEKNWGLVW